MKSYLFLLALPLLMSCEAAETDNGPKLQGKVVRITCATTVVQVTDSEQFGEDGWSDMMGASGSKYDNVFWVENICRLNLTLGQSFSFRIIEPKQNECVRCLLWDGPPNIAYAIEVLR